jgi:hypothetical protein
VPDSTDDAIRSLYSLPPDEFLQRRAELAELARKSGDAVRAQGIGKLRKPTVGAWIVNALVIENPSIVDQLTDLGERLRVAQDALDAAQLRELSNERRSLVSRLSNDAFRLAERDQPPAALRDEVTGTLDAAIADAGIASRLGRLQRAEQWSGFGFLPTGAPELTLVRGGRDDSPSPPAKAAAKPSKPRLTASERRRQERVLSSAQDAFEGADIAFADARSAEHDLTQEVRRLTKKLSKLQSQLDDARAQLEQARKDVTTTRTKRREARSALDRAERDAAD